jgi:hypothetical protein
MRRFTSKLKWVTSQSDKVPQGNTDYALGIYDAYEDFAYNRSNPLNHRSVPRPSPPDSPDYKAGYNAVTKDNYKEFFHLFMPFTGVRYVRPKTKLINGYIRRK